MTRSYPKDKKKESPPLDDWMHMVGKSLHDVVQCPYCFQLFNRYNGHRCKDEGFWINHTCSICNQSLDKAKQKTSDWRGRKYISLSSKKYFQLINSVICWNCAFKITKMFRSEADPE